MIDLGSNWLLGGRRRGGVPPLVVLPPAILAQPLIGVPVEIDEGVVTGATSTTYQWYRGNPNAGGVIIGGATLAGYTPVSADYGLVPWRRRIGTNAAGSTVSDTAAPAIVGTVYSETFAGFTVGNPLATILAAGWERASASGAQLWDASIVADAGGPSGKAISFGTTSTANFWGFRSDTDAFFGANGWSTFYEELFLIKHETNSARIGLRGKRTAAVTSIVSADIGPGLNIRINTPYLALPGETIDLQPGTALTALTAQYYFVRQRFEGAVFLVKVWAATDPEPETWTATRTHTGTLTARGPALATQTAAAYRVVNYISCGGNAPAPFWPGFVPPVPAFSDPQTFAVAAPLASVSAYNGLVTFNIEDV